MTDRQTELPWHIRVIAYNYAVARKKMLKIDFSILEQSMADPGRMKGIQHFLSVKKYRHNLQIQDTIMWENQSKPKTANQVPFENIILHYVWQIITTRNDFYLNCLKNVGLPLWPSG